MPIAKKNNFDFSPRWLRRIGPRPLEKDAPRKIAPTTQIIIKVRAFRACFPVIFPFWQGPAKSSKLFFLPAPREGGQAGKRPAFPPKNPQHSHNTSTRTNRKCNTPAPDRRLPVGPLGRAGQDGELRRCQVRHAATARVGVRLIFDQVVSSI